MPPTVFICYSHHDQRWKDRLALQLGTLQREGLLLSWHDGLIPAGADWFSEIETKLAAAQVAIFMVSAAFLDSDFINRHEVPMLMERRKKEGLRVIPVIVNPCLYQKVGWLQGIQARPRTGKTLAGLRLPQAEDVLVQLAGDLLDGLSSSWPGQGGETGVRLHLQEERAPAAALARVHQLKPPPSDFTGRDADLAALRTDLAAGEPTAIFGLRGMGGVGKTSLALKIAAELAPIYPDAQIYLDLQGVTTPLSPDQAMAHVVQSFRPEERLPENRVALEALYREVLFGKRALLLMDNAAGREQIESLVPPAGCALLVTSRFHFSLAGWRARDLAELSPEEAQALLLRICPRIGELAAELGRLCGGLPLALTLAGGALSDRRDLSPAAYASQLAQGQLRLEGVDGSLDLSCRLLPEHFEALWRQLAVFPGTFDAAAAAAVWDLDSSSSQAALGKLLTSSLLEWEEGLRRYRLHDLARNFAVRQLERPQKTAARRRHAAHFIEQLRRANELFLRGGEGVGQGLKHFDDEWGNIKAGQEWVAEEPLEDTEAARLCSAYPDAGLHCLSLRLHPREQIRWREAALNAARHLRDRAAEASHLGSLGLSYRHLGDCRKAIDLHLQRLEIARELGNLRDEAYALGNIGKAYTDLGDPRQAIKYHEQRLAIVRRLPDRRSEGHCLGNLATAYRYVGDIQWAIECHKQQLEIARELGDRRGERQALCGMGRDHTVLGEHHRAIELSKEGLAIARDMRDARGESLALGVLGVAHAGLGEVHQAIELFEQIVAITRRLGDRRLESYALGNLGLAHAALGDQQRPIVFFEQHLVIAREIGDRWGEGTAGWNLAKALEEQGELTRALELMQVRVDLERELRHPDADRSAACVAALRARLADTDVTAAY
jgi:tetratricopeptide (TPR) repeat protein